MLPCLYVYMYSNTRTPMHDCLCIACPSCRHLQREGEHLQVLNVFTRTRTNYMHMYMLLFHSAVNTSIIHMYMQKYVYTINAYVQTYLHVHMYEHAHIYTHVKKKRQ